MPLSRQLFQAAHISKLYNNKRHLQRKHENAEGMDPEGGFCCFVCSNEKRQNKRAVYGVNLGLTAR